MKGKRLAHQGKKAGILSGVMGLMCDGFELSLSLKVLNCYVLIKISYDCVIKLFCMFFLTFVVKSKIIKLFYILSQ